MSSRNYDPHPEILNDIEIDDDIQKLIDRIAYNNHEKWAQGRISEGYKYGPSADGVKKTNPYLKPYDELSDEEKQPDIASAEGVVKYLRSKGYKFTRKSVNDMKWTDADYWCYDRYYDDVKKPDYRAPLIIGLSGQEFDGLSEYALNESLDKFASYILTMFENKGGRDNSTRLTPVYLLSALANKTEQAAANYLAKYNFPVITVTEQPDGRPGNIVTGNVTDYIVRNSFMILSLWDGTDKDCGAGKLLRKALIETEPEGEAKAETCIGETSPVYQIVLPTKNITENESPEIRGYAFRSRLLLPYTLESGTDWYTVQRAVPYSGRKGAGKNTVCLELVGDTEYTGDSRKKKVLTAALDKVAAARESELEELESKYKDGKINRKTYLERKKKTVKKYDGNEAKARKQVNYKIAVENSKKKNFTDNAAMLRYVNRMLRESGKRGLFRKYPKADTQNAYDLLRGTDDNGTEINLHGSVRSADIVNLRHLRYDTIATERQALHRKMSILTAVFAGIGLSAYGIFSDLFEPNSYLGVLGGILTAVFIALAMLCFVYLKFIKNLHRSHVTLRMLSECLRIKTYWNAAGLADKSVDGCFSERQNLELEWARRIFRGWNVVDASEGFYNTGSDRSVPSDKICKLWLGTADEAQEQESTVYTPTSDGQLAFFRKRGNEFLPGAEKQSDIKSGATIAAVLLMLGVTIAIAFDFLSSNSIKDLLDSVFNGTFTPGILTENLFDSEFSYIETLENLAIFFIGIVPAVAACYLMYKETKMYSENAKRYKWMAVKYQKLISCFYKNRGNEAEEKKVFEEAGRVSVEETSEWTALISDNEINLPF